MSDYLFDVDAIVVLKDCKYGYLVYLEFHLVYMCGLLLESK